MNITAASFVTLTLVFALSGPAAAQNGAESYRVNCSSCHGTVDGPPPANAPERRGAAAVHAGSDPQRAAERQDADPGDAA